MREKEKIKEKKREEVNENVNLPNALSVLRILFSPLTFYFVLTGYFKLASLLVFLAFLTDIFDGFFAKQFNQKTEFGKHLDYVADAIFIVPLLFFMLFSKVHLFLFILLLSIMFLMAFFSSLFTFFAWKKGKFLVSKVPYAEFGMAFLYFSFFLFFLKVDIFLYAIPITILFYSLAFFVSVKRWIKILKTKNLKNL